MTEILDESAVSEIEAQITSGDSQVMYETANIDNVRALCATAKHLWAENGRVYTPSICEAFRLLDNAGYGKEVPNSLSEMIKKALAQLEQLRTELSEARSSPAPAEQQNG